MTFGDCVHDTNVFDEPRFFGWSFSDDDVGLYTALSWPNLTHILQFIIRKADIIAASLP